MSELDSCVVLRNNTAAKLAELNPTLHKGEVGMETDTFKFKLGDGETSYNELPYTTDKFVTKDQLPSGSGSTVEANPDFNGATPALDSLKINGETFRIPQIEKINEATGTAPGTPLENFELNNHTYHLPQINYFDDYVVGQYAHDITIGLDRYYKLNPLVPNYTGTTVSMTEEMLTSIVDEEHQKAYILPEAVSANVTSTGHYQTLSTLAIGNALYKLPEFPEKIPQIITLQCDASHELTFKNQAEFYALIDKIEAGEVVLNVVYNEGGQIDTLVTYVKDRRSTYEGGKLCYLKPSEIEVEIGGVLKKYLTVLVEEFQIQYTEV